jgi:hypothetical protein
MTILNEGIKCFLRKLCGHNKIVIPTGAQRSGGTLRLSPRRTQYQSPKSATGNLLARHDNGFAFWALSPHELPQTFPSSRLRVARIHKAAPVQSLL